MISIGIPKEIKQGETRVGLTPSNVNNLIEKYKGNILIKFVSGAGEASGFSDEDYINAGALSYNENAVWDSGIIVKVKEPVEHEFNYLDKQIVYGYFHLNSPNNTALVNALLKTRVVHVPYENIVVDSRRVCLEPMSAVAGRVAGHKAIDLLMAGGMLPGGITGTQPANVVVIGCGTSGKHAISVLKNAGANVVALDISVQQLESVQNDVTKIISSPEALSFYIKQADVVIGAVLSPGKPTPQIISKKMVESMRCGSCIIDISIDEGGCCYYSRPTSHDNPTYDIYGVTFYCVTNMPALVPKNSTIALTHQTTRFLDKIIHASTLDFPATYLSNIGLR